MTAEKGCTVLQKAFNINEFLGFSTVSTVHSPKPQKGKIYTKWYTGKFFKMAFSLYYLYQLHERR